MNENFNNPFGGDPGDPFGGQPQNVPPYSQPAPNPAPVKGKTFAILAFVFAMVAFVFFLTAAALKVELASLEALAESMTNSTTYYYVENADQVKAMIRVVAIISILFAPVSDILVVFAYIGHSQNVKNGNPVKFIKIFAILATVFANLSLVVSLFFLI